MKNGTTVGVTGIKPKYNILGIPFGPLMVTYLTGEKGYSTTTVKESEFVKIWDNTYRRVDVKFVIDFSSDAPQEKIEQLAKEINELFPRVEMKRGVFTQRVSGSAELTQGGDILLHLYTVAPVTLERFISILGTALNASGLATDLLHYRLGYRAVSGWEDFVKEVTR